MRFQGVGSIPDISFHHTSADLCHILLSTCVRIVKYSRYNFLDMNSDTDSPDMNTDWILDEYPDTDHISDG
jgi:hypothetical protein